jgi:hypothetical protein
MSSPIESSIVRIRLSANNQIIVGVGFQIDQGYVLTCAHVITQALGIAEDSDIPKETEISLDYPFINQGSLLLLKAHVVSMHTGRDVAVLRLLNGLQGTHTASIAHEKDLLRHSFCVFGVPKGRDDGVWATGIINRPNAKGLLQIEDTKKTGYPVQQGFSGSPVWDENLGAVIGMVVKAETDPNIKAAYILPAYLLLSILTELKREYNLTGLLDTNSEPDRNISLIHGDPVYLRNFHALLCHNNADKRIVDNIDSWLNGRAEKVLHVANFVAGADRDDIGDIHVHRVLLVPVVDHHIAAARFVLVGTNEGIDAGRRAGTVAAAAVETGCGLPGVETAAGAVERELAGAVVLIAVERVVRRALAAVRGQEHFLVDGAVNQVVFERETVPIPVLNRGFAAHPVVAACGDGAVV